MTVQYLVDTDWAIHWLNRHPGIVRRLGELQPEGVAVSIISLAELYEGVYHSMNPEGNERVLNEFLRGVAVLGVDQAICKVFGQERGRLRATKRMIDDFDLLIAATSLQHDLTLLTNNRRHFDMVEGLRLESI